MTFQVSLDEWMEGHHLYARTRNRFWRFTPFFCALIAVLMALDFALEPNLLRAFLLLVITGSIIYDWVWLPYRNKDKFKRDCLGDLSPPITYEFSSEGFTLRSAAGNETWVPWGNVKRRLEGPNVWLFIVKAKKSYWLVLPKTATESEDGRSEWAMVDSIFNPHHQPPIANPY